MTMKRFLLAVWMLCVTVAPARAQESVDLVLHNGKIFTADQLLSTFSAVAVRDDRIVALGWDGLLDQYRAARTVDLDGKLVVPGFIDTHRASGSPATAGRRTSWPSGADPCAGIWMTQRR